MPMTRTHRGVHQGAYARAQRCAAAAQTPRELQIHGVQRRRGLDRARRGNPVPSVSNRMGASALSPRFSARVGQITLPYQGTRARGREGSGERGQRHAGARARVCTCAMVSEGEGECAHARGHEGAKAPVVLSRWPAGGAICCDAPGCRCTCAECQSVFTNETRRPTVKISVLSCTPLCSLFLIHRGSGALERPRRAAAAFPSATCQPLGHRPAGRRPLSSTERRTDAHAPSSQR